jgi:hypothetical protein
MQFEFKASLDTVSKIITGLVAPIFTLFPIYYWYMFSHGTDLKYEPAFIGLIVVLLSIFAICIINWPKKYIIEGENLIIKNLVGQVVYNRKTIQDIQIISKTDMGLALRILGNGGLFGYTGWFTTKTLGRMRWFVTSTEYMVIITLANGKKIAVSPDEREAFVKAMKSA